MCHTENDKTQPICFMSLAVFKGHDAARRARNPEVEGLIILIWSLYCRPQKMAGGCLLGGSIMLVAHQAVCLLYEVGKCFVLGFLQEIAT